MLDARNIYRKVTRKIYDFSPEQMQNLAAIVWLYRGKTDRFLALVEQYLDAVSTESAAIPEKLCQFEDILGTLRGHLEAFRKHIEAGNMGDAEKRRSLIEAMTELGEAGDLYEQDRSSLVAGIETFHQSVGTNLLATNDQQHAARKAFDPIAETIKGLIKQVDLLYKLAARVTELAEGQGEGMTGYDRRDITRLIKQLDKERKDAVEQLKQAAYFHRQVAWLQDRFPEAELADVPGLVKLVDRKEIEAADWSLTPGRYVGVAPAEEDETSTSSGAARHPHGAGQLNEEAAELAAKIQENFEELGG